MYASYVASVSSYYHYYNTKLTSHLCPFFISLDYHTNLFLTMQNVAYTMFALCCIGAVIGAAVDTNTEHERMQM